MLVVTLSFRNKIDDHVQPLPRRSGGARSYQDSGNVLLETTVAVVCEPVSGIDITIGLCENQNLDPVLVSGHLPGFWVLWLMQPLRP